MRNSFSSTSLTDSVRDMMIPNGAVDVLNNKNIGKGTYGVVEKAKLRTENNEWIPVAIKYMHDKNDIQHLVRETRTMFQLKGHPHCVQVFGLFDCPGHGVGAVMEFMDCKSLADLILRRNIAYEMDHFISWMWQLASAVDYFHTKNELHRDLKLQNLLLSDRYRVLKVGDFGTFTMQRDSMKSLRGTPVTMAPEIFKSERYNKKCDIYSIGIIMWQLIARREPYTTIIDANALLWNVAAAGKRPPEVTCHRLLSDFYKRCWHETPAARPDSKEVLNYFTVLKKFYPKGNEPLIDEATQEPARTPQPQNIVLSPYLRGHRRTGSDQSTLTVRTSDSGIEASSSSDHQSSRNHSTAHQTTDPNTIRPDHYGNVTDFIELELRPPPPLHNTPQSNAIYNEHMAQCHSYVEMKELLRREIFSKHAALEQLKKLHKAKELGDYIKELEALKQDALKKIQYNS